MLLDLKYFLRTLIRNWPSFTLVLVSLSLGLGLTIAMFSIVDVLVLRPIPHGEIERVVSIGGLAKPPDIHAISWWRQSKSLEDLSTYTRGSVFLSNASSSDADEMVLAAFVSESFFSALGLHPIGGRLFRAEDYESGGQQVVIISAGIWRNTLGSNPSVIGTKLRINAIPHIIVGIMPDGFAFPGNAKLWLPGYIMEKATVDLLSSAKSPLQASPESGWIARLKPGLSLEMARSELFVLLAQLHATYTPKTGLRFGDMIGVYPLREALVKNVRPIVLALLAGAACVLLIALSNSITILLGLAATRSRELAVRRSLGAPETRLIRQLIVEALLLGAISGAAGLFVALNAIQLGTKIFLPGFSATFDQPILNPLVCGFSVVLSLIVGLGASLPSVLQLLRNSPLDSMREQNVRSSAQSGMLLRRWLILGQTAGALLLTIGAGLAFRTLANLSQVRAGFEPQGVLFASLPLPRTPDAETKFPVEIRELMHRLHGISAIKTVTVASSLPLVPTTGGGHLFIRKDDRFVSAIYSSVTTDYFQTLKIPVRLGRSFHDVDKQSAIVNMAMVREVGLPANPVGSEVVIDGETSPREIVGVVDDVHETGLEKLAGPHIYLPLFNGYNGKFAGDSVFLAVRCSQSCAPVVQLIREGTREITGRNPNIQSLESVLESDGNPARLRALILGLYAVLGFVLAVAGVYGLVTHAARTRRYEMGVRMALGGRPRDIILLMLRQSLTWAGAGLVAGVLLALASTRVIRAFLFGVAPIDASTFVAAVLLLAFSAFAAAFIPARKAAHTSPLESLQNH